MAYELQEENYQQFYDTFKDNDDKRDRLIDTFFVPCMNSRYEVNDDLLALKEREYILTHDDGLLDPFFAVKNLEIFALRHEMPDRLLGIENAIPRQRRVSLDDAREYIRQFDRAAKSMYRGSLKDEIAREERLIDDMFSAGWSYNRNDSLNLFSAINSSLYGRKDRLYFTHEYTREYIPAKEFSSFDEVEIFLRGIRKEKAMTEYKWTVSTPEEGERLFSRVNMIAEDYEPSAVWGVSRSNDGLSVTLRDDDKIEMEDLLEYVKKNLEENLEKMAPEVYADAFTEKEKNSIYELLSSKSGLCGYSLEEIDGEMHLFDDHVVPKEKFPEVPEPYEPVDFTNEFLKDLPESKRAELKETVDNYDEGGFIWEYMSERWLDLSDYPDDFVPSAEQLTELGKQCGHDWPKMEDEAIAEVCHRTVPTPRESEKMMLDNLISGLPEMTENEAFQLADGIVSEEEFSIETENGKFRLIDEQGAYFGDIGQDRFDNLAEVIDRLSVYHEDYIISDTEEVIETGEEVPKEQLYQYALVTSNEKMDYARDVLREITPQKYDLMTRLDKVVREFHDTAPSGDSLKDDDKDLEYISGKHGIEMSFDDDWVTLSLKDDKAYAISFENKQPLCEALMDEIACVSFENIAAVKIENCSFTTGHIKGNGTVGGKPFEFDRNTVLDTIKITGEGAGEIDADKLARTADERQAQRNQSMNKKAGKARIA